MFEPSEIPTDLTDDPAARRIDMMELLKNSATLEERDAFPRSKRPIYKSDLSVRGAGPLTEEYFMIISDEKKSRPIFQAIVSRPRQVFLFRFMGRQQRKLYYICLVRAPA